MSGKTMDEILEESELEALFRDADLIYAEMKRLHGPRATVRVGAKRVFDYFERMTRGGS